MNSISIDEGMPSEVVLVCLFGEFYRNLSRFLLCQGIVVPCMEDNTKRGYAARWSSAFAVLLASCTALAVWMPKKTNWIRRTYSDATEYLIVDVGVELLHKFWGRQSGI